MSASSPLRLCLIEDDPIMGESLYDRFLLEDYDCDWCKTAQEAASKVGQRTYAAVVSDIKLPDRDGEVLFRDMLAQHAVLPPWLFITGYGSVDRAVALLKLGAVDYITKPFDLDDLMSKLRALTVASRLAAPPASAPQIGVSPALQRMEALLPRIAAQAGTVLISGESGVGKEVVARRLHALFGQGNDTPFVAVNCGALSESLLEAELFGHEKGAFTGAVRSHKGVFEQANGGTLFLDEIGDTPLPMQVRLLRAIQERCITRVGGERSIPIDIKLVCATHQNLKKRVEDGLFREDLYYRIHIVHLKIPPLRERREDILWFVRLFLDESPGSTRYAHLNPAAEETLLKHDWPGNIRELKHTLERACIFSNGGEIGPDDLFEPGLFESESSESRVDTSSQAPQTSLHDILRRTEQGHIHQALQSFGGHMGKTAEALGISRKNLWEKMKKLGLSDAKPKENTEP